MTTLNLQVAASADDAHENAAGDVDIDALLLKIDATDHGGFRWINVTVPRAATIDTAIVQLYAYSDASDDAHLDVYGEDADNAVAFAEAANNITNRTQTTAKTDFDQDGIAAGGATWFSITVTALVQEVTERALWASGNALAVIADGQAGGDLNVRDWDFDDHSWGPKLDIDYTPARAARAMHSYRQRRV